MNKNNEIIEGMQIYPSDYFCPYDYNVGELNITDNSRSIHWYDASWFDNKMKKRRDVCVKNSKNITRKTRGMHSKIIY
jgi:hypothetical protein